MRSFPSLALLALTAFPLAGFAAGDVHSEYEQIRKIALRDHKVQEAFARANQRLDERIVEIDPALAGYVKAHPSARGEQALSRPSPAPAKAAAASAPRRTHVVAAGETVSSIAANYGVSTDNLQGTNHIRDARKLKVGQVLTIPEKK